MAIDFNALTPDDLVALKAKLDGLTDVSGRSPMRPRQLHDLRLLPTKDDPRPTFFMSADPPRNAGDLTRGTAFPALLWNADTGAEVTVTDAKTYAAYVQSGYLDHPLYTIQHDPMELLAQQLEALSENDRAALIESQRQDRISDMRKQLAALPEDKLAILLGQAENKPAKGKK